MKKQLALLEKYGITNYTIEKEKIIINGSLDLRSLTSCDKEFLKDTTINGYLDLGSLTSCDKEFARNNIKELKEGYNKEKNYCYFDGILNKVKSVTDKKEYKIYTTTNGYIAQKGKFTAHGKTIKKAIEDLRFKCIAEQLRKEPINKDTLITIQYYRIITGACESGVNDWISRNNITKESYKASELFPILEKTNAYGFERFKSLITWL